jgi:hypothetical protein
LGMVFSYSRGLIIRPVFPAIPLMSVLYFKSRKCSPRVFLAKPKALVGL